MRIKNLLLTWGTKLKVFDLLLNLRKRQPLVLYFHNVGNNFRENKIHSEYMHFPINVFKQQIIFISKHYEVISIDEYYYRLKKKSFTGKEIMLTFDDGYRNNLKIVAPLLYEMNMPFTVFISTFNVSTGNLFIYFLVRYLIYKSVKDNIIFHDSGLKFYLKTEYDKNIAHSEIIKLLKTKGKSYTDILENDILINFSSSELQDIKLTFENENILNWDEVKNLINYNATIGSHCHNHFICNNEQTAEDILFEFAYSKELIEQIQGHCNYLAYPNGDSTLMATKIAEELGYKLAFTTEQSVNPTSYLALTRLGAVPHLPTFVGKVALG